MWQKTSQKRISVTKKINLFLLFFLDISALVIYFVIVQKYLRFILLIIIFIAVISLIIDLKIHATVLIRPSTSGWLLSNHF